MCSKNNTKRLIVICGSIFLVSIITLACNLLTGQVSPEAPAAITVQPEQQQPNTPAPQPTTPPLPDAPRVENNLSPSEPWLIVPSSQGIWALNPDGTGLVSMVNTSDSQLFIQDATASPKGGFVAYLTTADPVNYSKMSLHLLHLLTGQNRLVTALTTDATEPKPDAEMCSPSNEPARAFSIGGMKWSPDGNQLAFSGAQESSSADVYLYALQDQTISHLSNEAGQAYGLSWSPNGKYIVYSEADCFGTGAGFAMKGVWGLNAETKEAFPLYDLDPQSSSESVVGWFDDHTVVTLSRNTCKNGNLQKVDLDTHQATTLLDACVYAAALAPDGTLATLADRDITPGAKPNLHILSTHASAPITIPAVDGMDVKYSPGINSFLIELISEGVISYSLDGKAGEMIPLRKIPSISPGGVRWAAEEANIIQIGDLTQGTTLEYPSEGVQHPTWSLDTDPNRQYLFFFSGPYSGNDQLYFAAPPEYKPVKMGENIPSLWETGPFWVQPSNE